MHPLRTALLLCLLLPAAGAFAAAPPNIVVIVSDDQGYHDLGCYGSNEVHHAAPGPRWRARASA